MVKQGLTNPQTLEQIQKLVDDFFQANSLHDNIVYSLATYLNAQKFYSYFHYQISHVFPQLADEITDFGLKRGDVFTRGALTSNNKEYANIIGCLQDSNDCMIELQTQLEICIDSAIATRSKAFEDFLRAFNTDRMSAYRNQISLLLDGAKQFEDEGILSLFNSNFEDFVVIPII